MIRRTTEVEGELTIKLTAQLDQVDVIVSVNDEKGVPLVEFEKDVPIGYTMYLKGLKARVELIIEPAEELKWIGSPNIASDSSRKPG
jgi:hypothetical protein